MGNLAVIGFSLFGRLFSKAKASCLCGFVVLLSGCSAGVYIERLQPLPVKANSDPLPRHVYLRNYEVGKETKAFIGQPVLRVRDIYYNRSAFVTEREANNMPISVSVNRFIASDNFTIEARHKGFTRHYIYLDGRGENIYKVNGGVEINGVRYNLIDIMDRMGYVYSLLIDNDGNLVTKYLIYGDTLMDYTASPIYVSAENLHFRNADDVKPPPPILNIENIFSSPLAGRMCGRINLDLIYGGINNVTISFAYREYTVDNFARPAFSQNLIYETGASQIRFQNVKMQVLSTTNEEIRYKVLEDGLSNSDLVLDGLSEKDLPNPAEVDFTCGRFSH